MWLRLLSVLRRWFCCCWYFPLFVGVLCLSLFCYALLCVHSSFTITLKIKRKLVAFLLLSYRCIVIDWILHSYFRTIFQTCCHSFWRCKGAGGKFRSRWKFECERSYTLISSLSQYMSEPGEQDYTIRGTYELMVFKRFLTLSMLGNFCMLFCHLLDFFSSTARHAKSYCSHHGRRRSRSTAFRSRHTV